MKKKNKMSKILLCLVLTTFVLLCEGTKLENDDSVIVEGIFKLKILIKV